MMTTVVVPSPAATSWERERSTSILAAGWRRREELADLANQSGKGPERSQTEGNWWNARSIPGSRSDLFFSETASRREAERGGEGGREREEGGRLPQGPAASFEQIPPMVNKISSCRLFFKFPATGKRNPTGMAKIHPNPSSSEASLRPEFSGGCCCGGGVPKMVMLTVWRKSLHFNGNGFTVFDAKGNLAFRVDNYSSGSKGEIVLMDAAGKLLLSLRRKRLSLGDHWLIYDGEGEGREIGDRERGRDLEKGGDRGGGCDRGLEEITGGQGRRGR